MSARMFNFFKLSKIGLLAIYQAMISERSWEPLIQKFTMHDCEIQLTDKHQLIITAYLSQFDVSVSEPFRVKIEPPIGNLATTLTIWLNQTISYESHRHGKFRDHVNNIASEFEQLVNALFGTVSVFD